MADRFLRPAPPPAAGEPPAPLWRRLGWFALIAAGSGAVVAATAYLLRSLLFL